jgi:hypothetical protein
MKKQFAKLPKTEQENVETAFHKLDPHEFDGIMTRARMKKATTQSRPKVSGPPAQKKRNTVKREAPR